MVSVEVEHRETWKTPLPLLHSEPGGLLRIDFSHRFPFQPNRTVLSSCLGLEDLLSPNLTDLDLTVWVGFS